MNKEELLNKIELSVSKCTKCELYKTALKSVPGHGNINSEIVFIGEAPGESEDKSGLPFVGRAGKLLDSMLSQISLKREDIWIGNIIKHRPPNNRDPLPEEIKACEGYLTYQLRIINPKLVVTLGRFAMNYFYPQGKISKDRGSLLRLSTYNIYPVYHPAAALRNPTMMSDFREDFVRIPEILRAIKSSGDQRRGINETDPSLSDGQLNLGL